jgi:hypothetical protein
MNVTDNQKRRNRMTDELTANVTTIDFGDLTITEVGSDGIRRSFDEHYDSFRDVEQNPTGAMWAIHKQARRIEELEEALLDMVDLFSADDMLLKGTFLRAALKQARAALKWRNK